MQETTGYEIAKNYTAWIGGIVASVILCLFLIFMIFAGFIGFMGSSEINNGFLSGSPTDIASLELGDYLTIFQQAQDYFDVPWAVLAAIASVESGFGKSQYYLSHKGISEAGAVGFMQFMPTTWSGSTNPAASDNPLHPRWDENPDTIQKYGGYGVDADKDGRADPYDPHDAIFSAAKYLKANRFNENPRAALLRYNRANWYVDLVLSKAETYAQIKPSGDGLWPLPGEYTELTSPYGKRNLNGNEEFHPGIDIACPVGTPVYAVIGGAVSRAGWVGGYGYCVMIEHPGSLTTVYGHLSSLNVSVGQKVEAGSLIALSGNTGRSTGPHLHFEVRISNIHCNPMEWLKVPSNNY